MEAKMISRLDKHEYFMSIAIAVASRSTCPRRAVGCVITDDHDRIMATGFNGVPRGEPHCIDEPCLGANMTSGEGLEICRALHAEQNALAQCKDILQIYNVYCTTYPCLNCLKQIINTSVKSMYFMEAYSVSYFPYIVQIHQLETPFLLKLKQQFDVQCNRNN